MCLSKEWIMGRKRNLFSVPTFYGQRRDALTPVGHMCFSSLIAYWGLTLRPVAAKWLETMGSGGVKSWPAIWNHCSGCVLVLFFISLNLRELHPTSRISLRGKPIDRGSVSLQPRPCIGKKVEMSSYCLWWESNQDTEVIEGMGSWAHVLLFSRQFWAQC